MPHPRLLTGVGVALVCTASLAGCFTSAPHGDPGSAFTSGSGSYGAGGAYGAGTAGAYGAAGATGAAGSTCTGAAGATAGTGGVTDGGAPTEAGAASDAAAAEAGPTTEGGATAEGGTTNDGDAATDGATISDGGGPADAAGISSAADASATSTACPAGGNAAFALAWTLEDGTGAAKSCDDVGGKTVEVQVVNAATCATSTTVVACAALAATTCALPAGTYALSMKLRDAAGNVLSEIYAPTLFLDAGETSTVASLPLQVGGDETKGRGFALTWSLERAGTTTAETCAQAGAASVRLIAGTTMFDLPCADGEGLTTAIAPGTYPISLHLVDASGADLSVTQTMNISIAAGQLVFLGDVPFDL